ncbi:MAG: hypothetical protein AB1800_04835 [Pseudomonadota bacterium]
MQEGLGDRALRRQLEDGLARRRLADPDLQVRQHRHVFDTGLLEGIRRGKPGRHRSKLGGCCIQDDFGIQLLADAGIDTQRPESGALCTKGTGKEHGHQRRFEDRRSG